jgi:hypothetical protein
VPSDARQPHCPLLTMWIGCASPPSIRLAILEDAHRIFVIQCADHLTTVMHHPHIVVTSAPQVTQRSYTASTMKSPSPNKCPECPAMFNFRCSAWFHFSRLGDLWCRTSCCHSQSIPAQRNSIARRLQTVHCYRIRDIPVLWRARDAVMLVCAPCCDSGTVLPPDRARDTSTPSRTPRLRR